MNDDILELINIKVSDIIPYKNNAKKHPQEQIEQIKQSIVKFGMNDPIAVDENNVVIEGHGRLIALKQLNSEYVSCIRLSHLSEADKRAYIIAHNKTTLNSDFDFEMLKEEFEYLKSQSFEISFTGFDMSELSDMFEETTTEVKDDDFDATPPEVPFSKQGDIYILGQHRLIVGDSTNPETISLLMDGKKAELIITDPPYNVAYEAKAGKIKNDNMEDKKFYEFLLSAFKAMYNELADGGSIYVFHADRESINFRTAFRDTGFHTHQTCIWVKNSPVIGHCQYHYQHEVILYGWKPTSPHRWYAERSEKTIWYFNKPSKSELHPTMKSLDLIAYPISVSSKVGDIVLDPFGGSGSTLISCDMTDRICYTCELDEKYADVIVKRYREHNKDTEIKLLRNGDFVPHDF